MANLPPETAPLTGVSPYNRNGGEIGSSSDHAGSHDSPTTYGAFMGPASRGGWLRQASGNRPFQLGLRGVGESPGRPRAATDFLPPSALAVPKSFSDAKNNHNRLAHKEIQQLQQRNESLKPLCSVHTRSVRQKPPACRSQKRLSRIRWKASPVKLWTELM